MSSLVWSLCKGSPGVHSSAFVNSGPPVTSGMTENIICFNEGDSCRYLRHGLQTKQRSRSQTDLKILATIFSLSFNKNEISEAAVEILL
ncbi:hypothetical protein CDAR_318291 [Caerostris darwini]|uniref:Uncharacterized protein n=1 Tax=Caerostris darwini TaxID=1538125 RepID=A0AAV4T9H0_9ARAC|nr:hypothetical protein CDAR_318291 [Caerostris darwini]